MRVSLRTSFTEEKFNFLFYSLKDLVSEIGGLGGAVAASLSQFGVYIMMLFVVDMVMVIRQKNKQKKRMHNILIIGNRLPFYKKVVLSRIYAIKMQMNEFKGYKKQGLSMAEAAKNLAKANSSPEKDLLE